MAISTLLSPETATHWLERWDRQQEGYILDREARFDVMLAVLGNRLGEKFMALDLACGPGSLAHRIVERFPSAAVIAIDLDPLLMALGRSAFGDVGGRLRWLEADLNAAAWVEHLDMRYVDAIVSTTALHWLHDTDLVRLYRQCASLLREGGVFLNGDHIPFAPQVASFREIGQRIRADGTAEAHSNGVEDYKQWHGGLRAVPELQEFVEERDRRFEWFSNPPTGERIKAGYEFHRAMLLDAGFREVDTIWQNLDDRVLLGIR